MMLYKRLICYLLISLLLVLSGYSSRTEKELAVLSRWFPKDSVGTVPTAKYLDLILYSREQIRKENDFRSLPEKQKLSGFKNGNGLFSHLSGELINNSFEIITLLQRGDG